MNRNLLDQIAKIVVNILPLFYNLISMYRSNKVSSDLCTAENVSVKTPTLPTPMTNCWFYIVYMPANWVNDIKLAAVTNECANEKCPSI